MIGELWACLQAVLQRDLRGALEDLALSSVRSPVLPPDCIVHGLEQGFGRSGPLPQLLAVHSSADGCPAIFDAVNAANSRADSIFCTKDRPGQWLCYTFLDRPRFVSAYVIESCPYEAGSVHPRSWALDGSNDGTEWTELDRRVENTVLNGASILGTFAIKRPGAFRQFRLCQTRPNHSGNHVFAVGYFDLCGDKQADKRPRVSISAPDIANLNRIIAHLTREYGGNVARKGAVKVTGFPLDNASNHSVENVVDLDDSSSHFWSKDSLNQTLSYDFCERRIVCTAYVIQSTSGGDSGFNHLRSWVIEVAAEAGGPWLEIDCRTENSQLNLRSAIVRFDIENPIESRLIRLRQTDRNHFHSPAGCTNSIVISGLELFGDLILSE
jgi:hypothetical protein